MSSTSDGENAKEEDADKEDSKVDRKADDKTGSSQQRAKVDLPTARRLQACREESQTHSKLSMAAYQDHTNIYRVVVWGYLGSFPVVARRYLSTSLVRKTEKTGCVRVANDRAWEGKRSAAVPANSPLYAKFVAWFSVF